MRVFTLWIFTYEGFALVKRFNELSEAKQYFKNCEYVSEFFEEENVNKAYIMTSNYATGEQYCEFVLKG